MDYEKLGYLADSFKLFYLKDVKSSEFEAHYHEFDKIILFLGGKVNYVIEGQSYQLFPYDIVFVGHNNIHYLKIDNTVPYERIVMYINPYFLQQQSDDSERLDYCFDYAKEHSSYVMHLDNVENNNIIAQLQKLKTAYKDKSFAYQTYIKINFLEFMILLNRAIINNNQNITINKQFSYDKNILSIIDYINKNLFSELNIEQIATAFFISKYYLMRHFKAKTGYSIHQYILNKRLMCAKERIQNGGSLTQICFDCGFKDYSAFSRNFKKAFGQTPREIKKSINL